MASSYTRTEQATAYLSRHMPRDEQLDYDLLEVMLYLADWKSTLEQNAPITELDWYNGAHGPFAPRLRTILHDSMILGLPGEHVVLHVSPRLSESSAWEDLDKTDIHVLQHVLSTVKRLRGNNLSRLVYSTYPMLSAPSRSTLNLSEIAKDYKTQAAEVGWHLTR
jgi:hypothetical protein